MYTNRLIPCLLIKNQDLVKTIKFKNERYLGDPINAVKIYNDREADELIILDIDATKKDKEPDFDYLKKITDQCFMPACYGGGVKNCRTAKHLFEIGFEKVSINTALYDNPKFVKELVGQFGGQSIVAAVDIKRNRKGDYEVFIFDGKKNTHMSPDKYLKSVEKLGVGEIFVNFIDLDGTMSGMDYEMIGKLSKCVSVPLIACGGSGTLDDCLLSIRHGASAVACGSLFSFWGRNKAVLINYPGQDVIKSLFLSNDNKNSNKNT